MSGMADIPTAWQTAGPFFTFALIHDEDHFVVSAAHPDAITISGVLIDGAGDTVPDGILEVWQADQHGNYLDAPGPSGFRGFGRVGTDTDGRFEVVTVKPGRVAMAGAVLQAPHVAVSVMARGMLKRTITRVYFQDELGANAEDPILSSVAPDRRATLIAARTADRRYEIDIWLQGERETVFFDV
jgi:protocatechuate 3,4-dioxygenase alpha subunit